MGCRYIYSIYDAKSGALVAKGDAAKLVGLGLFRDAGVLSTSYHKNRECKRPRKYRIEREKVVKTFVMTTPQKALRSMYIYSCYDARDCWAAARPGSWWRAGCLAARPASTPATTRAE